MTTGKRSSIATFAQAADDGKKRRISGAERREKIVEAAAFVFADRGFEGATTNLIAARAKVSEALLYRHFTSKSAIYRAVLQKLMRQQNAEISPSLAAASTPLDYLRTLRDYLARSLDARDGTEAAVGQRLLLASLAGDGQYAKLIYRRVLRILQNRAGENKAGTRLNWTAGIEPVNGMFFISYIGLMLAATSVSGNRLAPYAGERDDILRDALTFCARGLGLGDGLVEQLMQEGREQA